MAEPKFSPEVRRYALGRCDAALRELQALLDVLSSAGPSLVHSHSAVRRLLRLRQSIEELK